MMRVVEAGKGPFSRHGFPDVHVNVAEKLYLRLLFFFFCGYAVFVGFSSFDMLRRLLTLNIVCSKF